MKEPPAAAFFDFDRTVLDGDAGVLFGRELLRIQRRQVREARAGTLGWLGRNVRYEGRFLRLIAFGGALKLASATGLVKRSRSIRRAYQLFRGLPYDDVRRLAHDYFDEVLAARIFPEAAAEMESHREAGRNVIVVSTGMHLLIDGARRHLPVDDVIAVHLDTKKGLLTGKVKGPLWGRDKARDVRDYAHEHGLTLPRSHAYSDHHSDLPFLRLVGHPHAVNATRRLRREARRRKWPVHLWRIGGPDQPLRGP